MHSKLLLHYARRLCTKTGTLPPPDLQQLVTTEALVLVSTRRLVRVFGLLVEGGSAVLRCGAVQCLALEPLPYRLPSTSRREQHQPHTAAASNHSTLANRLRHCQVQRIGPTESVSLTN